MRRRRFEREETGRAHTRAHPGRVRTEAPAAAHPLLALQRAVGNRAVAQAIAGSRIAGAGFAAQRAPTMETEPGLNPWKAPVASAQFVENYGQLPKITAAMHQLASLSHIPALQSLDGLSDGLAREITTRAKAEERVQLFSAIVSGVAEGFQAVKLELPAADQQHTSPGANQISDAGEVARESVELLKQPPPIVSRDPRTFLEAQKLQIKLLLAAIEQLVKSANTSTSPGASAQPAGADAVSSTSPGATTSQA